MTKPTATSIVQAAIDANTPAADRDATLLAIAKTHLDVETLETRRSSEDFAEQAVWTLRAALEAAYEAGRASMR